MNPHLNKLFLFILSGLFLFSCKGDDVKTIPSSDFEEEIILSDTVFGELNEKQQYYQHLLVEVPLAFQKNIDSLASWIVNNEPGALSFNQWQPDSISRLKFKLDTFDIIQPFFYSDYFTALDLPAYPFWDASIKNQDLKWLKSFQKDQIALLTFNGVFNKSSNYYSYLTNWKNETGSQPIANQYNDLNIKEDYTSFVNVISESELAVQLELNYFDTVQLANLRKPNKFKGLFVVKSKLDKLNMQLRGGADFVHVSLSDNLSNAIPYDDWMSFIQDERTNFDKSTLRILKAKQDFKRSEHEFSSEALYKASQLNLLSGSTSLLNNKSDLFPLAPKAKIYCEEKINLGSALKAENKFKVYQQNLTDNFNKIVKTDGVKIVILQDTISTSLAQEISELKAAQKVIVCFSNTAHYEKIKATPNLVFFQKQLNTPYQHGLLLQQLTGQLALIGSLVLNDSIIAGGEIVKRKLARMPPEYCGFSSDSLKRINWAVSGALNGRAFPGCQVLVAKNGCIIYDKSFGYHTYSKSKSVTPNSLYDVASLTKVVATTMVGMKLYEMNAYQLNDSLEIYLPDSLDDHLKFPSTIRNITFQELFTHQSGMPSGFPIIEYMRYTDEEVGRFDKFYCDRPDSIYNIEVAENFFLEADYRDSMWLRLNRIWLDPSKEYRYSDVNMNTLYFIFKSIIHNDARKYGFTLRNGEDKTRDLFVELLYEKIYRPLGMNRTGYKPRKDFNVNDIVPTENERYWRKQLLQGHVHDPNAALYGGVGGNAGIFSTANDLAILGEMLLQKGTYNNEVYLKPETVEKFTNAQPNSFRGLGWNKPSLNTAAFGCANSASVKTFGHTGFTGTCIWVDPVNNLTYIFLSNRVHPTVNNRIYQHGIRARAHQMAYEADMFK